MACTLTGKEKILKIGFGVLKKCITVKNYIFRPAMFSGERCSSDDPAGKRDEVREQPEPVREQVQRGLSETEYREKDERAFLLDHSFHIHLSRIIPVIYFLHIVTTILVIYPIF